MDGLFPPSGSGLFVSSSGAPSEYSDIWFEPDDTEYIGYKSSEDLCSRPRNIYATRGIDIGGTSNNYNPVLNLVSSGDCTDDVVNGYLQGHFYENVVGVTTPIELKSDNVSNPILFHSIKTLSNTNRSGAIILTASEPSSEPAYDDRLVEIGCVENADGDGNSEPYAWFTGARQLVTRLYESDALAGAAIGFGQVPSASYRTNTARAGLETYDTDVALSLWSIRSNGADNVSCEIIADVNTAVLNSDHKLFRILWRNDSDTDTELFTFTDGQFEIVSDATAQVLGTEADGASAVGVQVGSYEDFTTSGARVCEFVNNSSTVRGYVGYNGDLGINMLGNGQRLEIKTLTELTTIAAAASTSTTIQIPANAVVLAVSTRVTITITGTSTYDVGVSGATTRYGSGITSSAGNTSEGTDDATRYYSSATSIVITPDTTPSDAAGRVRVTIHYYEVTAPTS